MYRIVFLFTLAIGATLPAATGRVIRGINNPDQLYYLGADHKRYPFPRSSSDVVPYDVFDTWYADASEVITVSQAELESTNLARNVTVRPASVLLKLPTDPKVYVAAHGGVLREIAQNHAARLFGDTWQAHVLLVPDAFFINYTIDASYTELAHPDGLLFRYAGSPETFLLDGGSARPISAAMMAANGFRPWVVFTIPDELRYRIGSPVDRREERISTPAGPINMFTRGEVNNLPSVNLTDALVILQYLFVGGAEPGCLDAADVDDRGGLNLTDAVALLNYLFLAGSPPSFPGVSPIGDFFDFDPTPDSLTCGCFRCDLAQLEVTAAPLALGQLLAGTKEATIGRFTLSAKNHDVSISAVTFELTYSRRGTSDAKLDRVSRVKLITLAGEVFAGPVEPQLGGETVEDSNGTATFTQLIKLETQPFTVTVVADLAASIPAGDLITVAIVPPAGITTQGPSLLGPTSTVSSASQTVVTAGTLELRVLPSSASAGFVPGATNDVQVGELVLRASNEDIRLERLDLTGVRTNPNVAGGAWGQLRTIKLYHEAALVAQTIPISDGGLTDAEPLPAILDFIPPVMVPSGTSLVLRATVDTAQVSRYGPNPGPGYSGQGFALQIADPAHVRATGAQSATRVTANVSQAVFPAQVVCVTVPTVTLNEDLPASLRLGDRSLTPGATSALPIYRYRVDADFAADLALAQTCLRITVTGNGEIAFANLRIAANEQSVATGTLAAERRDGNLRLLTYRFTFDDGAANPQPLTVPAGTARILTAYADVSGVERGTVVMVQLLGDDGFPAAYPAPEASIADRICALPCTGSGHFVWSDLAYSGPLGTSDPRLLGEPQWYNGHRVRTSFGKLPPISHPLLFSNE